MSAHASAITIDLEGLNLIKQWFNAVEDLNPKYLEGKDYLLLGKLVTQNNDFDHEEFTPEKQHRIVEALAANLGMVLVGHDPYAEGEIDKTSKIYLQGFYDGSNHDVQ